MLPCRKPQDFSGAKIEKNEKIFYKNIYFCKSFSNGIPGRVVLCSQGAKY
jgi:hypothetical protein